MIMIKPPVRGSDPHGAGYWHAPRAGGKLHRGIDMACYKGSKVFSVTGGLVTKIGYPYNPNPKPTGDPYKDKKNELKSKLRYIQITYDETNYRYMYVDPFVKVGDTINEGDPIGLTQGLCDIYPGITDHFHFEIKRDGVYLNPEDFV